VARGRGFLCRFFQLVSLLRNTENLMFEEIARDLKISRNTVRKVSLG
jgi:predicted DNA-binding transcriptional regulator YafY